LHFEKPYFAQFGGHMEKATYKAIHGWVKDRFGFAPKPCWIAHAKELLGLPVRCAPNRMRADSRSNPYPEHRKAALVAAFIHFGMIPKEGAD
jgi:hypothetical protein